MRQVESCPAGVTWGVGHDGRLHVYTGGYGGAFFKGACINHPISIKQHSIQNLYHDSRNKMSGIIIHYKCLPSYILTQRSVPHQHSLIADNLTVVSCFKLNYLYCNKNAQYL